MTESIKSPLLTVPELAKAAGVSDQTVRRWVRRKLVPSTRNGEGWPMLRLEDVPPELLNATKKLSGKRYPKPDVDPEDRVKHPAEIAYLRNQNERLLGQNDSLIEIIKLLSSRPGDHPINA